MTKRLHQGQRVKITGATGTVTGTVLRLETPATLPVVHSHGQLGQVREILAEGGIVELAILTYRYAGQPVMFVAMRNRAGKWTDLQHKRLTIEPVRSQGDQCT